MAVKKSTETSSGEVMDGSEGIALSSGSGRVDIEDAVKVLDVPVHPDDALVAMDEGVLGDDVPDVLKIEAEDMVCWGYSLESEVRDRLCVLGRNAVSPVQACAGSKCMAWKRAHFTNEICGQSWGRCGLVGGWS